MIALTQADIDALVAEYREWRAFDEARSPAAEREALKTIAETLNNAAACLGQYIAGATDVADHTPPRAAWQILNSVCQETMPDARPLMHAADVAGLLTTWATVAGSSAAASRIPKKRHRAASHLRLAIALLVKFRSLGIKCPSTRDGDGVQTMMRVGRLAGDTQLTEDVAVNTLKAAIKEQGSQTT